MEVYHLLVGNMIFDFSLNMGCRDHYRVQFQMGEEGETFDMGIKYNMSLEFGDYAHLQNMGIKQLMITVHE